MLYSAFCLEHMGRRSPKHHGTQKRDVTVSVSFLGPSGVTGRPRRRWPPAWKPKMWPGAPGTVRAPVSGRPASARWWNGLGGSAEQIEGVHASAATCESHAMHGGSSSPMHGRRTWRCMEEQECTRMIKNAHYVFIQLPQNKRSSWGMDLGRHHPPALQFAN